MEPAYGGFADKVSEAELAAKLAVTTMFLVMVIWPGFVDPVRSPAHPVKV